MFVAKNFQLGSDFVQNCEEQNDGPSKQNSICDRICKKGSYTRTTSTHRFHHHSIDTLSDNPWVHVLWPTVHQSAFPEAVSGACQTSMNAQFVSSCPCWLLNKGHRAVRSHTTL